MLAQCLDQRLAGNLTHRHLLFPVLARLALAAGDAATATATVQVALEEAESEWLLVPSAALQKAAVGHCRGLMLGHPGPVLAAAAHYGSAGRPVDRAQALEDAAVLLAGHGELMAAQRAFDTAAGLYNKLRALWDMRRADARLSTYGIRRSGDAGCSGQSAGRRRPRRRRQRSPIS